MLEILFVGIPCRCNLECLGSLGSKNQGAWTEGEKIGPCDESNALGASLVPLLGDRGLDSTATEIDRKRILLAATSDLTFPIIVTKVHF